jgi:plasmid stabilization system protein ParE
LTYALHISPRAARQIEQAADWWYENRSAAPQLFSAELERGFLAITSFPRAGERVEHPGIPELRRILLSAVQFHLYYTVSDDERVVEILELWHTSRTPRLS